MRKLKNLKSFLANISNSAAKTIFYLHCAEVFLLLVSLPLSVFTGYIITKSRQTKIIHINLSYAAYFNIAQIYMIVFVRLLLFALKITCAVEDASIFGPLGIIHTIREALIANCTFALPSLAVDRYLSTRYPEDYERSTTPYIAFIILITSSIFAVIIAALRFMNILSFSMAALIIGGTLLVSLMVFIYLHNYNKKYINDLLEVSLSKKFQVRENLLICKALIPSASFMSILIIVIAILFYFVFTMQDNPDIAVTLATLYNTSVAFIFFISPFVYILPQREMRNMVLVLFGCSSTGTIAPMKKLSSGEEQNLYFQELNKMWS